MFFMQCVERVERFKNSLRNEDFFVYFKVIVVTSDDVMEYVQNPAGESGGELSMDELEAVAGGKSSAPYDVGGLFACGGVGIGFGTTSENNDKCFIIGLGVAACASEGSAL